MVTVMAGKANNMQKYRVISASNAVALESRAEFDGCSRDRMKSGEPKWGNYVKGCIANFPCDVPTFDAVIVSNVPAGAGLSSSAALEVATYTFLEALSGRRTENLQEKALACQRAEHKFAGVPCGIMDQFISVMGKEGCALLLDCKDLSAKQIPMLHTNDHVFLVTNSNAPHKLSSSAYCERRDRCYEAANRLNKKSLRDATIDDIKVLQSQDTSPVTVKRARHVVTEIKRTLDAALALEQGDLEKFGRLMNESHDSLKNDYEVSSEELDCLVAAAREVNGVLGSRLTGAGFGGCTVTLLRKDAVDATIHSIKSKYPGTASFYIAKPADGARPLSSETVS